MGSAKQLERDKYIKIEGFLEDPLLFVAYRYALMKAHQGFVKGYDPAFPSTPSYYADTLMETLLELSTVTIEEICGIGLYPTYSYFRVYRSGDELPPHKDRESCEYSMTLCLGSDPGSAGSHYLWPIYVKRDGQEEGVAIPCGPGDAVIYKGCEVTHWRTPFEGKNQAQVFLHYVGKNGANSSYKWDRRPSLGLSKNSRR